jgi:hypothetical protein
LIRNSLLVLLLSVNRPCTILHKGGGRQ